MDCVVAESVPVGVIVCGACEVEVEAVVAGVVSGADVSTVVAGVEVLA